MRASEGSKNLNKAMDNVEGDVTLRVVLAAIIAMRGCEVLCSKWPDGHLESGRCSMRFIVKYESQLCSRHSGCRLGGSLPQDFIGMTLYC